MKVGNGPFYLLCAFTLAGTSVISARFVSGKLGVFTITAASLGFALLFLLPACAAAHKRDIIRIHAKDLLYMAVQALFGVFLFRMFLLVGLTYTSSGEAGLLTGATPAITAILAVTILKEYFSPRKAVGILCTVIGILLVQKLVGSGLDPHHLLGNGLVLCAAACESLFNTFSRIFAVRTISSKHKPVPPLFQTTIVSVIALLFCLIPAAFVCNGAGLCVLVCRYRAMRYLNCGGIFRYDAVYGHGTVSTNTGGALPCSAVVRRTVHRSRYDDTRT